jgi:hypothetical protein
VGSTAPYGHDGQSINLEAVIRRHAGEATASAQAYRRLSESHQGAIRALLRSLVLFPPDDTASNLRLGDPTDRSGIQNPLTHGSINLGALFQIAEEGSE